MVLPADATGTVTQAQWLADVSTDLAPAWTYIEQYVADPDGPPAELAGQGSYRSAS